MSDPSGISGHQRVAALLLSLDANKRSAILKTLRPDVIEKVARAMVDLDERLVQAGAVDSLYRELALSVNGPKSIQPCDTDELGEMLTTSFGKQKGERVLQDILSRRLEDHPFLAVEGFSATVIGRVLERESSAVAALVLANLDPSVSAKVLQGFEPEDSLEIIRRMATLKPPARSVTRTIAEDLTRRLEAAGSDTPESDPSARLKSIAELLNFSDPQLEKGVIDAIASEDEEMAQELREYMFTWQDIATIDKRSMQKILGTVDTKTLSVALKACSSEVEENVLGNLSSRVREMVSEERELTGPVPMSEVESAREEIMRNIRAMIEAGEFRPSRAGEDLVS